MHSTELYYKVWNVTIQYYYVQYSLGLLCKDSTSLGRFSQSPVSWDNCLGSLKMTFLESRKFPHHNLPSKKTATLKPHFLLIKDPNKHACHLNAKGSALRWTHDILTSIYYTFF